MTALTRSPIEIMPATRPASTTGRCRTRLSVTSCMHSCTVASGVTVSTGELMMSRTGVSPPPPQDHLERVVALGNDARERLAVHDEERPDAMLGHEADRVQHRSLGPHRVHLPALAIEQLTHGSHERLPDTGEPNVRRGSLPP